MKVSNIFVLVLFCIHFSVISASDQTFGIEEKSGSVLTDNIYLLNEDSVPVLLSDIIRKPTLLVTVYYRCNVLCPKMLAGISELVRYTSSIPEDAYQIFCVSINHKESVHEAQSSKDYYLSTLHKKVSPNFWRFFTADSLNIRKLTNQTGLKFTNENSGFIHPTASVLVTPSRKISQYFFGTYFNYMHFALSVKKASNEEVVPTRVKNMKYCSNLEKPKNNYTRNITLLFGVIVILLAGTLFTYLAITKKSVI